ncbi:MAG: hypothetical protein M1457_13660 [bacterium]|nr:hypothetical protein [bacterium]
MRKVINITLMTTVAIALLGLQTVAFGMAPVISGIPDPVIVGDVELSTPDANYFVYPDAFNLANYVSDESILPENLIWSYAVSTGTSRYLINGVQPLDLTTEDPQSPPAGKVINNLANVSPYEWNPDGNANTITVRNNVLTPLSSVPHVGNYPDPSPNTNGILASETQILTLFAGDGTTLTPNYDQVDVTFKSDNWIPGGTGGNDRYGTQPRATQMLRQLDFVANGAYTGTDQWTSGDLVGTATFSSTPNGLTVTAPLLGDNIGIWTSPDAFIQLTANSVWRLRMKVTSDQTTPYAVPLWDTVIENFSNAVGGPFGYGLDYFFLDNAGGAEAAGPVGRTDFEVWYTPSAITTPQFSSATTGAFAPAVDAANDMRVRFRVLDAGSSGINANFDSGSVSLQTLEVHRFDLAKVTPTTVFNAATITDGSFGATLVTDFTVTYFEGTVVDFTGGIVTMSPENASIGWGGLAGSAEVINVWPGDSFFNPLTGNSIADNFPITWENNTLYRVQMMLSTGAALGNTNPPDIIYMIADTPQNELTCCSYITPGLVVNSAPVGTPKTTAATYQSFFYSHSVSRTGIGSLKAFRPLLQIISANSVVLGGVTLNTGNVRLHSVNVARVTFAD